MADETKSYAGFMHAGGGTGLFLVQLSAIIPGLLPTLALLGVIMAVIVLPLVAIALAAGVLAAPPLGAWLVLSRIRARHAARRVGPATSPLHP